MKTRIALPIGIETQIQDTIEGTSISDQILLTKKIQFARQNCHKIVKINGDNVFYVIVAGEELWYCLEKAPDSLIEIVHQNTHRPYYYPIKYAFITYDHE